MLVDMDDEEEESVNMSAEQNIQMRLLEAIQAHCCAQVYEIIHVKGLSPNYSISGCSPICKAAHLGFVDILDILVEGGCDLQMAEGEHDIWHRRALHIAASKGHIHFVKRLLEHGADINCRDDDQRTPLHWAATYGNAEMTAFLIANGGCVNIAQCDGFTPLHAATCLGHNETCKVLLEHGAEINRTDRDGWSAFHTSVCYGHIEVVKTLLAAGASLTKVTNDEENVIHIAASSGKLDIAKLLVEKGAPIDELNLNGNTALYLSVYYREYEMAKFLIQIGANMYLPQAPRKTPFYLAAVRGYKEYLMLFIEADYKLSSEEWLVQKEFPSTLLEFPEFCSALHRLAVKPNSLKEKCRRVIRLTLYYDRNFENKVNQLDIPKVLKKYVSYEDF